VEDGEAARTGVEAARLPERGGTPTATSRQGAGNFFVLFIFFKWEILGWIFVWKKINFWVFLQKAN
jgi:hypothetical protein